MGKRKRIGFIFSYNENWIAGTYYILNIINALKTVEDNKKPEIIIFTEEENNIEIVKNETGYPYLSFIFIPRDLNIVERVINKITRFANFEVFPTKIKNAPIDLLYPNQHPKIINEKIKKVFWIPDFQEEFLPELFSEEELSNRKRQQKKISENADVVVFSSNDVMNHYWGLYPNSKASSYILHFAVSQPDYSHLKMGLLREKFSLPEKYYFSPNQFWAHKNHMIILKAIKILKDQGIDLFVAFSGKDFDFRNREYVASLKKYIMMNGLERNICFLGFLDRKEQLLIMKNSLAIIQPSLFEGWSTVVEDAKALNKFIILSDLPVHSEQIAMNCEFFDRSNELVLSNVLKKYWSKSPDVVQFDYGKNIVEFGNDFIKLIDFTAN